MGIKSIAGKPRILDCAAYSRARVAIPTFGALSPSKLRVVIHRSIVAFAFAMLLTLGFFTLPANAAEPGSSEALESSATAEGSGDSVMPGDPKLLSTTSNESDADHQSFEAPEGVAAGLEGAAQGGEGSAQEGSADTDGSLDENAHSDGEAESGGCSLVAVLRNNGLYIRVAQDSDKKALQNANENGVAVVASGVIEWPPVRAANTRYAPTLGSMANPWANTAYLFDLGDGSIPEGKMAPWYDKRGSIQYVSIGEGVKPLSMAHWFTDLIELRYVDFGGLDTSQVGDMRQLFSDCASLKSLDLSGFKTSCVTSMAKMFSGCSSVEALDLTSFDTSSVTSMSGMFSGNTSMKSVNVSTFNTSNVEDMADMFSNCSKVAMLDLSSFKTGKLKLLDGMFSGCTSLAALDVSGFSADQLSAASIPVDNAGGFWRLNVPAGFETNVKLREPTEAERAMAGDNSGSGKDSGEGDNGGSGNSGKEGSGGEKSGADDGGKSEGGSSSGVNQGGEAPTLPVSAASQESPAFPWQDSFSYAADEADLLAAQAEVAQLVPTALFTDALGGLVSSLITPVAQVVDSAMSIPDVSSITTGILDALGIKGVVNKTVGMIIAAIGMIAAAGLMLVLCLKIR